MHINDNFAKFSEALYVADRHAREEVRARAQMQQLLAQKEKAQKEENLRLLAQRSRDSRGGIAPVAASSSGGAAVRAPVEMGVGLGGYGSESDAEESEEEGSQEDDEAVQEREQVRAEKRREREKEMRMNNMGTEMRTKLLAK